MYVENSLAIVYNLLQYLHNPTWNPILIAQYLQILFKYVVECNTTLRTICSIEIIYLYNERNFQA